MVNLKIRMKNNSGYWRSFDRLPGTPDEMLKSLAAAVANGSTFWVITEGANHYAERLDEIMDISIEQAKC